MKNALRILILIACLWFVGLLYQKTLSPHFMLDSVLPPTVLAATSYEERTYILERLRMMSAPSDISWFVVSALIILSSYALWAANQNEKK